MPFYMHAQVQQAPSDSVDLKIPKVRVTEMEPSMKAALFAAVLPGAGQAYNKKYWKIPLVYAGVVGFGYSIQFSHERYVLFRNALLISTDNDPNTVNEFPLNSYDNSGLQRVRDAYRRNRDLSIILSAVFYGLTIADAVVDAHLQNFDVSDDLSVRVSPKILSMQFQEQQNRPIFGLSVSLQAK